MRFKVNDTVWANVHMTGVGFGKPGATAPKILLGPEQEEYAKISLTQ